MTDSDLVHIERELGIRLPTIYGECVVPYPIPALAGNTESELWDDPAEVIQLNRELRLGDRGRKQWPEWLFAVGQMDGESYVAIDLRHPDAPTWWVDHGHIDASGTGRTHEKFKEWATEYVNGLRWDLAGDGYDPDSSLEEYRNARDQDARRRTRHFAACVLFIAIGLMVWRVWWR